MVRIDRDDYRAPLVENCFPGPGGLEVDGHPNHRACVLNQLGIRVKQSYRLDALAIRRQQDDRAKVSRGTRDLLGNDAEQGVDVWNRADERVRRRRQLGRAVRVDGLLPTGRYGLAFGHDATLFRRAPVAKLLINGFGSG